MNGIDTATTGTAAAALAARERVGELGRNVGHDERRAAQFARAAVFEEALLAALKARFAALRTVAR
ncbi:MAG: hypothetical protein JOZ24_06755 [Candidatus Eremiobacteraeota bacterium]|nr:hypothetical protein [Candidatus Eremiobacteraeota bacterium]